MIFMIVVVGGFVGDPDADDDGDGHADRKTGYIDKGVSFVLGQMAPGDAEIVLEHNLPVLSFGEGEDGAGLVKCCLLDS